MKNKTNPDAQLKTLWGASSMPFGKIPASLHRWDGFETAEESLNRMLSLRLWGIVHGPNGVGKSQMVHAVAEDLPEKAYRVIRLSHSRLSASDLLRSLCHALQIKPAFRRADIVELVSLHWLKMAPVFPVLFLDEAQNLTAQALEELRLLSCAGLDTRNLFSLVLIGDENLMPRLELGINHALLQRMGYQVQLAAMNAQQSKEYIESRLKEVGLHTNPFEEAALNLLVNGTDGIPRCLNLVAQAAMQSALENSSRTVTAKHVQKALEQLRWLAPNHIP